MKSFKDYLLEEEQANETPSVGDIFEFEIARDETLIETTIVDVLEDGVVLNADATAWSIFESAGYFVEYQTSGGGGDKSPIYKKVNKEQSGQDEDLAEGFPPNKFQGEIEDFHMGPLYYEAVVDDDGRVQVVHDSIRVVTGGPNSPEDFRELDDQAQYDALEAAQEDAEEVWSERDDKYAHYIDEGKVKDLLMDVQELSDKEFQEKYNMSKAEAKEKFNLDEAEYQGRKVPLGKPMRGDVKKFKVYVKDPKTGNVKKVNFGHGGTSAKKAGQKTMKIKKSNPARRKSFRARHNCSNPGPRTKARYWSCRAW